MIRLTYILQRFPFVQNILNYAGFILFYPLSKIFNRQSQSNNNIVILSFHKLGDTVFTIPAIREIIKKYQKDIYIFCYPESEIIYKEFIKDKVFYITFLKDNFFLNERIASSVIRRNVKKLIPKIIFDLTISVKSASIILLLPANLIVGSNKEYYKYLYTHFTPERKLPHLIGRYLNAISPLVNVNFDWDAQMVEPNKSENTNIIIHPFAGWAAKEWNFYKYVELAHRISLRFPVSLIFQEGQISADISNYFMGKNIRLIETKTIHELIEKIKDCAVLIGSDSGPIYIGYLLGKKTFTIYGPTNPEFSLPLGGHHRFINLHDLNCIPNYTHQYCFTNAGINNCPSFQCMNELKTEHVYNKVINYLEEYIQI